MKNFENGIFDKNDKIRATGLYKKLEELHPECYELFLAQLVKVARSSSEKELLKMSDVLLGFACEKKESGFDRIVVDTTVDEIFPILNTRNPEKVKELVSEEYSSVLESLDELKENSDDELASKCLFGSAILTFPGSEIIDQELEY